MTGEQIRGRGFVLAAVGAALVAWVVVFAALADVGNPQVLVGTAVSAGLVCLCPAVAGLVATRITGAESAARVRHVFVVLEGVGLAVFFPFYWFTFGIEPAGRLGHFLLGVVLALMVPVVAALLLTTWATRTVHWIAVPNIEPKTQAASGPVVPDSGAPAQQMRVLGAVLVVVGVALSIGVTAVACTVPSYWLVLEIPGLLMTLTPVLLGTVLMRVKDVHSARRRNVGSYFVALIAGGFAVAKVGSIGAAPGMLFGALTFGAVVLVVVALLVVREYTADWKPAVSR